MSNRTALGGYDVQSGSHIAPGARREFNVIQLAGRNPLRPVNTVAWSRGKTDHALFPSSAALKLTQFAQTMIDVSVGLLIAAFVLLLFASPFIAAFLLLFVSF